jgi:phenylacetate-CoA ligase
VISRLHRHLVYPLYELVTGRRILTKWRELERTQWLPWPELQAAQERRLAVLLEHAWRTVPYYRRVFRMAGIELVDLCARGPSPARDSVRAREYLRALPLLTKETIHAEGSDLLSTAYSARERVLNYTGGSTGTPLLFHQDRRQRDWGTAIKLRCNRWAGWDFGKSVLRLWGHSRDVKAARALVRKLRNWVLGEHMLDAFYFTDQDMDDLSRYIIHKKPQFVVSYASMLAHFVNYVEERQIVHLIKPDGIVTSADMLYPHQRAAIERAFRARVFNRYGCREVDTIAAECDEHSGMHICAERLVIEILDEQERPVAPGQPGRVVLTDLYSYAMPFIRYDIGDIATLSPETCRCGRGLALLSELVGRTSDVLKTPEGAYVSVTALSTILPQIPEVRETQFVQRETDWLQIRVVRRPEYSSDSEAAFRRHVGRLFGRQVRVTFDYVDEIPKTPAGKARLSIGRDLER